MSQPTVVCVMLVDGRAPMVRRAVESYKQQTYEKKRLFVFDSGAAPVESIGLDLSCGAAHFLRHGESVTIGTLRNYANDLAKKQGDIFLHWDSDDWSHPRRIEEQVALLQASGREVVGYREMLFWRTDPAKHQPFEYDNFGEAWLYRNAQLSYCLGTSLCYWRDVWERKPFGDHPKKAGATGEDTEWIRELRSMGVESDVWWGGGDKPAGEPRMIASIHGANTQYYGADLMTHSPSWVRVPSWDDHCKKVMKL